MESDSESSSYVMMTFTIIATRRKMYGMKAKTKFMPGARRLCDIRMTRKRMKAPTGLAKRIVLR